MKSLATAALLLAAVVGCNSDIDEQWELDHDRIIAVRAEPPGIEPGETSRLEMLAGYEALPVETRAPEIAMVVSPASLASTLSFDGANWIVTAPSADDIAAARVELGLEADAPVPLVVGVAASWPTPVMSPQGNGFAATKTVWLGRELVNPALNGVTINGLEPADDDEVVMSKAMGVKTKLFVEADDQSDIVNWLTSCGTMHDFDLSSSAYLTYEEEDRTEGQLALVLRDKLGGVSWRIWSIRAE